MRKKESIESVEPEACQWVGHQNSDQVSEPGVYEATKTAKNTDGILHTYMSHEEDELHQTQSKVIQVEAMEHLMCSSTDQDQICDVESELGGGGEQGDESMLF